MNVISRRRRSVVAGMLAGVLSMTMAPARLGAQEAATESALRQRVKDYYATLVSQKFEDIWTYYLADNMKRDTPKEEYVRTLATTVGKSKLTVGNSAVGIERTGRDKARLLGRSVTQIKVLTSENQTIEASHTTFWLFQEIPNSKPGWMLAGDAMKEKP